MSRTDITVLVHASEPYDRNSRYILNHLWSGWEVLGHRVRLAEGVSERVPGDILFMHVDRTVVPEEYLDYAKHFPVVINGKVRDVSKNHYSSLLLSRGDEWGGRVIVKTKANFGGHNDVRSEESGRQFHVGHANYERPWRKRETLDPHDYPVFDSLDNVPSGVWRNPHLIVERFMPEIDLDGLFVIRFWHFFGDKGFVRKMTSPYHIVKPVDHDDEGRECHQELCHDPVPRELVEMKQKLGFDYGRFDYVEVEGRGILFDANPTPVIPEEGRRMFAAQFDSLVSGIEQFI